MKYIQLNNTDLNISPICLGTAGFGDKSDLEKSFEILNAFVWAGGNFIDTANVYCKWLKGHGNCSEQIIGKWLKESGMQGKVIVATKGAHYSFEDPGRSRVNKEDIRMDRMRAAAHWEKMRWIFTGFTEMIRRNRRRKSWIFWKN